MPPSNVQATVAEILCKVTQFNRLPTAFWFGSYMNISYMNISYEI